METSLGRGLASSGSRLAGGRADPAALDMVRGLSLEGMSYARWIRCLGYRVIVKS